MAYAIALAEDKGYEVRQVRLSYTDHGGKATVVLYLSPKPVAGWRAMRGKYTGQNVGPTPRRNIENLVAYVEGLPNVVQQADRPVDTTGGHPGVHDGTTEYPGEGGPRPA